MARAGGTSSTTGQWMPFAAAEARAGSLKDLLAPLREERIAWRGTVLGGNSTKKRILDGAWWDERSVHNIDPLAGRARFTTCIANFADGSAVTGEMVVIGIELERAAVEALWPVKPKSPGSKRATKGTQQVRVKQSLKKRFPDGVPDDISTEAVRVLVGKDLEADSRNRGLADPSWDTVNRALGRGKK